jgi:hypothetical protein
MPSDHAVHWLREFIEQLDVAAFHLVTPAAARIDPMRPFRLHRHIRVGRLEATCRQVTAK